MSSNPVPGPPPMSSAPIVGTMRVVHLAAEHDVDAAVLHRAPQARAGRRLEVRHQGPVGDVAPRRREVLADPAARRGHGADAVEAAPARHRDLLGDRDRTLDRRRDRVVGQHVLEGEQPVDEPPQVLGVGERRALVRRGHHRDRADRLELQDLGEGTRHEPAARVAEDVDPDPTGHRLQELLVQPPRVVRRIGRQRRVVEGEDVAAVATEQLGEQGTADGPCSAGGVR